MNTVEPISLALAGMIVGQSLLALVILPVSRANTAMRITLAVFLVSLAVVEVFPLVANVAPDGAATYFFVTLPAQLLCAPAIWLYIREASSAPDEQSITWRDAFHAGPALLALLVLILSLMLARPASDSIALEADVSSLTLESLTGAGVILVMTFWVVQLISYGAAIVLRLLRHRRRIRDHFANVEGRQLIWVTALLAALFAYLVQAILFGLLSDDADELSIHIDGVSTLVLVAVICVFGLTQGQTFTSSNSGPEGDPSGEPQKVRSRYANSALSRERSDRIAAALHDIMETDQIYRDSSLSLSKLAKAISTPPDYVTQTLNEILGETFFEFVNRWRIEAACKQLLGSTAPITEIALDVGYNSRSAFYRAFSKITSKTPSEYRRGAGQTNSVVALTTVKR